MGLGFTHRHWLPADIDKETTVHLYLRLASSHPSPTHKINKTITKTKFITFNDRRQNKTNFISYLWSMIGSNSLFWKLVHKEKILNIFFGGGPLLLGPSEGLKVLVTPTLCDPIEPTNLLCPWNCPYLKVIKYFMRKLSFLYNSFTCCCCC